MSRDWEVFLMLLAAGVPEAMAQDVKDNIYCVPRILIEKIKQYGVTLIQNVIPKEYEKGYQMRIPVYSHVFSKTVPMNRTKYITTSLMNEKWVTGKGA